jgi:hypothetical protein
MATLFRRRKGGVGRVRRRSWRICVTPESIDTPVRRVEELVALRLTVSREVAAFPIAPAYSPIVELRSHHVRRKEQQ